MDLILAIKTHLEKCSTDGKYDETQRDSFMSAFECLETALEECESLPEVNITLQEAWDKAIKTTKPKAKASMTWSAFVDMLKKKDFFKGVVGDGKQYEDRLRKAQEKYLSRWPGADTQDIGVPASTEQKQQAEELKQLGNQALTKEKNTEKAVKLYSQAVALDNSSAIFFGNRSACYYRLKKYDEAVMDAQESIFIDSSYYKGYNRLGTAYKARGADGDVDNAIVAFEKVMEDNNITEKTRRVCEKHIADLRQETMAEEAAPNPFGGMGGMGGLSDLLSGLGGAGGPGGLDLGSLLKNPQMQQMAQQFMQDPSAMSQMQGMMSNPQFMQNMGSMMGGQGENNNMAEMMSQLGQTDPALLANLQQVMADPVRRAEVMEQVLADPEVVEMKTDPELGPILNRLQAQDMSALTELMGKPEIFGKIQGIISKYM